MSDSKNDKGIALLAIFAFIGVVVVTLFLKDAWKWMEYKGYDIYVVYFVLGVGLLWGMFVTYTRDGLVAAFSLPLGLAVVLGVIWGVGELVAGVFG
ncbi:hypothetical protein V5T82_16755 [Magnetovibrio sp. PR-2]|uniref:hypothetical protein n=1 Tax=Magnetovibrio sp. PR-2 TaxID=3120356 RepID=UPI002FCE5D3C